MRTTVTAEYMQKRIKDVSYSILPGTTVTICLLTMANGFSVMGKSACVNPHNFDAAVGRKFAYEDAVEQLWPLEGYLLAEELFHEARGDTNTLAEEQATARYTMLMDIRDLLRVPTFEEIMPRLKMTYDNGGKDMTFGAALAAMKNGDAVARTGWNGKGMFVYLVPAAKYRATTEVAEARLADRDGMVPYNAYFAIRNVDDTVSTWVPSVNDCVAEDWCIV